MDKAQSPVRRNRKPLNLFRNRVSEQKERIVLKRKKLYRKDKLTWLKTIFKGFKKVFNWIGGYFGKPQQVVRSTIKPEKRYPHWFCKRIGRNRRRNKIAKASRRANR